ncbi:hypothetical protein CDD80_3606 [Ophiocordyceps camponoti-rufipedis]|uniref:EKC/KEOPS complex subunit BUD32 n=1 Tax=Ophiocordyceps camponoti-rufipedis TaxID=2004952 RepID=A0A2C5Y6P9_9HYPO|nr:hypothetical protein CDD80_3606 [Ophiocordyceps camponoti-rufipedis]
MATTATRPLDPFSCARSMMSEAADESTGVYHALSGIAQFSSSSIKYKLAKLQHLVCYERVPLEQFHPLVKLILDKASSEQVLDAATRLLQNVDHLIPVQLSFQGISEIPLEPTDEHYYAYCDLEGDTKSEWVEVAGFFDRFFSNQRDYQQDMLKTLMEAHGSQWTVPPLNRKDVWPWLCDLEKRFCADAPNTMRTSLNYVDNDEFGGLYLQQKDTGPAHNDPLTLANILVYGASEGVPKHLASHANVVFAQQPTRRLFHAFYIDGSNMELFVYDRAGVYSSGEFSIRDEPRKFARAIVGYLTMSRLDMGIDNFIKRTYEDVVSVWDNAGKKATFTLERLLSSSAKTTCFSSDNSSKVVKLSWISESGSREASLLKLAEYRGVKGVSRLVADRQITTIAELRRGLRYPRQDSKRQLPSSIQVEHDDNPHRSKRQRCDDSKVPVEPSDLTDSSDSESDDDTEKPFYENKIYQCMVIAPYGRPISHFGSAKELLESMRDAIVAHESLFVRGGILHRDVSPDNILITKPEHADGFKGILIDLDHAQTNDDQMSYGRNHMPVGTEPFMGLDVLRREEHTYRHDLESFFYCLLWLCAKIAWRKDADLYSSRPKPSVVQFWVEELELFVDKKLEQMVLEEEFAKILDEFPPHMEMLRPLCISIRLLLFPKQWGEGDEDCMETPEDPNDLYRPMLAAFDDAIAKL